MKTQPKEIKTNILQQKKTKMFVCAQRKFPF